MSSEVEETLKRLVSHKGVIGTIVVNNDGIPIKSTLDNHTTTQYAGLINQLVDQVNYILLYLYIERGNHRICSMLVTKSEQRVFRNYVSLLEILCAGFVQVYWKYCF